MLTFAIATFFALALIGSLLVIGLMFTGYREEITHAILNGLSEQQSPTIVAKPPFRVRTIKPHQVIVKARALQPVQLRVAA